MNKILFFYLNAFSQTGGIQTFNKFFISAIEDISSVNKHIDVELVSLYDDKKDAKSILPFSSLNSKKTNAFKYMFSNAKKFDIVIFAHINLAPIALLLYLLNPKVRIVFCTHGIEIWKELPKYTQWIMNRSTILTVSSFSKQQLLKYNPSLKDIRLFPNCIKMQDSAIILDNPYNQNEFNILSVSRLTKGEEEKGIDSIIKTIPLLIEKIPNLKYSIVGKGEDTLRLQEIAKKLHVEKYIDFLGFADDINAYYQHCDLFSLPSKKEGFGIVYLEAMQYKKPVIAVNYGGATDVVIDGETGFLCEYDDINCLSNKIIYLFKNISNREQIGENGFNRLNENFTYKYFVTRLKELLK